MTQILRITKAASERIKHLIDQRAKKTLGIKVKIKSGGCSGLSYVIEYADEHQNSDEEIKLENGISVFIDQKALLYLINSEMDYKEEIFQSGFVFNNPNEKIKCKCGKSFNI